MMLKSGKILEGAIGGEEGLSRSPATPSPVRRARYERERAMEAANIAMTSPEDDVRPKISITSNANGDGHSYTSPRSSVHFQDSRSDRSLLSQHRPGDGLRGSFQNPPMQDEWSSSRRGGSTMSRYRKNVDPEKYDGTESVENYLERFEEVAQWNGWSEVEKAMQLSMHLTGVAKIAVRSLTPEEKRSYSSIHERLMESFDTKGNLLTNQQKFWKRFKSQKESLPEFANELRILANRAFSDIVAGPSGAKALEEMLINRFVTGLSNAELGRYVHMQHPKSLQHAVSLARDYEAFDLMGRGFPRPISQVNMVGIEEDDLVVSCNQQSDLKEVKLSLRSLREEMRRISDSVIGVKTEVHSLNSQIVDCKQTTDQQARDLQALTDPNSGGFPNNSPSTPGGYAQGRATQFNQSSQHNNKFRGGRRGGYGNGRNTFGRGQGSENRYNQNQTHNNNRDDSKGQ